MQVPQIALGKLGQIGLLLKLYKQILIPREVYNEVVVNGIKIGASDAAAIKRIVDKGRILVEDVILSEEDRQTLNMIDAGEAEVIALSKQKTATWVLIDNEHARRIARLRGLPLKGTIGILVEGFRKGFLSQEEFEFLIAEIQARPELWISDRLCDYALQKVKNETGT
jgi:predicted nucleic acid-binding protein